MVKVTYGPAIRAVILLILLVVFFYLFFWQVVTQYLEKLTNTAKIVQKAEIVEVPTFTICSGWKKSLLKEYQVSPTMFSLPLGRTANLPPNATLRTIFDDVVFKLNEDFVIGLSPELSEPTFLKLGLNEIETKNSIYKYEVKEIVGTRGMCYAIIPMGVSMQPYEGTMLVAIARNKTLTNEEMTKVSIQISSNDTYNTVVHKISGMKNRLIEQDFTSKDTSLQIFYTEENTEFIKDCSDSSFFKRWAKKMKETEQFNCTKKCIPLVYDSLMDVIYHGIPKCTDPIEKDEYCMLGLNGYGISQKLKSTCIKQCKFKGSNVDLSELEQEALYPLGKYDTYTSALSQGQLSYSYLITVCLFVTDATQFCVTAGSTLI